MGRTLPANIKLLYEIISSVCVTFTLTVEYYFFVAFQIDLSVRRGFCMLPMLTQQVPALSKHHNYICDF